MKLKCVLPRTDFVPMIKSPRFWIASETIREGSVLDVEPEIGHQILAAYPGAFHVLDYGKTGPSKSRNKKIDSGDLITKIEDPEYEVQA